MTTKSMIKIKKLKEKFQSNGIKISAGAVKKFIKIWENKIELDIKKISRNLRISGRKVVRVGDIQNFP